MNAKEKTSKASKIAASLAVLIFVLALGRALWLGLTFVAEKLSPEQLTCEETAFDCGTVSKGDGPRHDFVFVNSGKKPIRIIEARPGCSSCVKIVDYEKKELLPGDKAVVTAELISVNLSGHVKRAALIKYGSNPDKPKRILVYLTANVVAAPAEQEAQ